MKDKDMTKSQLIEELKKLHIRVAELELMETEFKRVDAALKKQRSILDNIINLNPYSIQIFDVNGHHIRNNRAFINLFKEAPPREYCLFDDPILKRAGFHEQILKVKNGEIVKIPALWYNPHDINPEYPDKQICVGAVIFPILNLSGNVENIVVMHEDITEQERVKEDLKESEQRYRKVTDSVKDIIFTIDLSGNITFGNRAAENLIGYSKDELLNMNIKQLVAHKEDLNLLLSDMEKVVKGGKTSGRYEFPIRTKSGKLLDTEITISRQWDSSGNHIGFYGVARDITERKKAEKALLEERQLFIGGPVVVFIWKAGVEGIPVEYVSPNVESVFGYRPEDFTNGKIKYADIVHPDDLIQMVEETKTYNKAGLNFFEQEYRIANADGEYRWLSDYTLVVRDSKKAITHYHGYVLDITERKLVEDQILRQRALLDGINRVLYETLTCETAEEVARACLAVGEELTDSKFGFIGEVNQSGRFDTIALSDPVWKACRMPRSDAVLMIKNMEIRGIWGRVLNDKQSLIVNDPASHRDRVGIPKGHPPLTSFLGIPLKHAGKTIGMFALANKESGYDLADQQDMEALSVAFVEALNRKRAEEEIEKRRKYLESVLYDAPDAIVTLDASYCILDWNTGAEKIFGYSRNEVIGKNIDDLISRKDVRDEATTLTKQVLSGEKVLPQETVRYRKDGTPVNVIVAGSPIRIGDELQGVVAVYTDITERKQTEKAALEHLEELEKWRKLTIGREIKMIELKKKIKELEQQLSEGRTG